MPNLPAIKSLLQLFELPELELSAPHARSLSHTARLVRIGALKVLPVPDTIWVPYRDDEVAVDLEPCPNSEGFGRYKCPETGRWIAVVEADVRRYAVDWCWLAGFVGGLINPAGGTAHAPLIPGVLLPLGPHQIGDRVIDVLLCRRFDYYCTCVGGVLQTRPFRQPTLLLTTGITRERLPASAGYFLTLPLAECLIEADGLIRLDLAYLVQALNLPREALVSASEVYFNPASGELRLPGKPITHFIGDQQIAVILRLYQAWQQKSPDVKASELLKSARTETPTVPQLFSGRSDWKTFIASPKRGWYRLNV
jgi:hypothetical protein